MQALTYRVDYLEEEFRNIIEEQHIIMANIQKFKLNKNENQDIENLIKSDPRYNNYVQCKDISCKCKFCEDMKLSCPNIIYKKSSLNNQCIKSLLSKTKIATLEDKIILAKEFLKEYENCAKGVMGPCEDHGEQDGGWAVISIMEELELSTMEQLRTDYHICPGEHESFIFGCECENKECNKLWRDKDFEHNPAV